VTLCVAVCATLACASPALASPPAPPKLAAKAATLSTMDGLTLWSRNSTAQRRVASTIKMLNALVVRDRTKLTDVVTVTSAAARIDNGDVGLVTGQKLTVHQLLALMLIPSANDAAEALAIHIGGSEKAYVVLMNAKAKSLGLKGTIAADAHGLGKRESSTAYDLSVVARRFMADPVLRAIVAKHSVAVPRVGAKSDWASSTDRLLGVYRGIEGVKTGFTAPAGYCFVGAARRGDVELVGVVLGTDSIAARFAEMRKLLDWGFAHAHTHQVVSRDTTIGVQPVGLKLRRRLLIHPVRSVSVTLLDGAPATTQRTTIGALTLPLRAGQQVGTVRIYQGTQLLASVPLAVLVAVPAPTAAPVAALPAPEDPPWYAVFGPLVDLFERLAPGAAQARPALAQ
jgi:D-alanyl-D-alanine carboxypeptidase